MCESGGQLADDSTAGEHLRRVGRPYAIWWALVVFPLSCCRMRRSTAGCCRRRFYSGPEGRSPEGCSPRDTPLPEFSPPFSKVAPSRGRTIPCGGRGWWTPADEKHVNLEFTRDVRGCVVNAYVCACMHRVRHRSG